MSGDAFFKKGGVSRNTYDIKMSGIPGICLFISPNLLTYVTNIGIWWGSIPMYTSMFWVTLAGNSTSFWCAGDTIFHDANMIYVA